MSIDEEAQRDRMIVEQLESRHAFGPRVLAALRETPRHVFVPREWRHEAYEDRPLPIGEGQTISQPYMVAVMTEALAVEPSHRVLEIGTGSGYQAAILCRLAREVVSIERHARLSAAAAEALAASGCSNVRLIVGDGTLGEPRSAPFDRILVTAGAPAVPYTLQQQLADGGRLVIPVGPPSMQYLTIIERQGDGFTERRGDACVFVPLVGTHGWDG
jgi:protein-L-isoaspartate(D-aspartate) O-methyltransferase